MIEIVRISEKGKQQLITLKRRTGIENWNTLCRWALCFSLSESSTPPDEDIQADSNIEMAWKTFAGADSELFEVLIKERLIKDGLEDSDPNHWFKIHLHRGISYLNQKVSSISDLSLSLAKH